MTDKTLFGTLDDGREVFQFTLQNKHNIRIQILNYGGIITGIFTPDRHGNFKNVVLAAPGLQQYVADQQFLGATIGRYCNRIKNGRFSINGKIYELPLNNGENHLHGGPQGFHKQLWEGEFVNSNTLKLSYLSKNGEAGYPGNVLVTVYFSLDDQNALSISYEAETDKATHVNLTNHSYFNLSGEMSGNILSHFLWLNADSFTPFDKSQIPTGEIKSVLGTPLDFTQIKKIGKDINAVEGGYDHNFVLNKKTSAQELTHAATLIEEESGRQLKVFTTEPGIQFYSGNSLDGSMADSAGNDFTKHTALCLETQHFPDSPNQPRFPSTLIEPGKPYYSKTVFQFSVSEKD